ncbi:MAG TPA: fumarylacetoacetate hydrolase family protein [Paracoccaceae bacterium]|nr:fumarylacetoacetate hydrolase family protein [Paracoccaceae bacterium]
MTDFTIPPAPVHSLPVRGTSARFPVRRIYCIGRNYAEHAVEMGGDPDREPPFFFMKPATAADPSGEFPYPEQSEDVHHEIELAAALGLGGRNVEVQDALSLVWGYGVALDMTLRDLQNVAKKASRPWETAKAFERSAPISELVPAEEIGHPDKGAITLEIDGEIRQSGDLAQMIWKLPEIVATLSRHFELAPGDLILTGTPAGVGPVHRGQTLRGTVEGVGVLETRVA